MNKMIETYKALYYNPRHNCFLYTNPKDGLRYFDTCANEFIAKYSLMNYGNTMQVLVLNDKLRDPAFPLYYNNSIYAWLELNAPERLLQKFHYRLVYAEAYPESTFSRWSESDIQVLIPLSTKEVGKINKLSYFDEKQFKALLDDKKEPTANEYEKLIWKYIHKQDSLTINDISLYTADALLSSIDHWDIFIYTPIVLFIIREILSLN
jgi:hypothetical protein